MKPRIYKLASYWYIDYLRHDSRCLHSHACFSFASAKLSLSMLDEAGLVRR